MEIGIDEVIRLSDIRSRFRGQGFWYTPGGVIQGARVAVEVVRSSGQYRAILEHLGLGPKLRSAMTKGLVPELNCSNVCRTTDSCGVKGVDVPSRQGSSADDDLVIFLKTNFKQFVFSSQVGNVQSINLVPRNQIRFFLFRYI